MLQPGPLCSRQPICCSLRILLSLLIGLAATATQCSSRALLPPSAPLGRSASHPTRRYSQAPLRSVCAALPGGTAYEWSAPPLPVQYEIPSLDTTRDAAHAGIAQPRRYAGLRGLHALRPVPRWPRWESSLTLATPSATGLVTMVITTPRWLMDDVTLLFAHYTAPP